MKKLIFAMILLLNYIYAAQVEITSKEFFADEGKMITEFVGDVVIVKEKDRLRADKILVNFDDKRQPLKYTATGNVKAKILMENKTYDISGNNLTYEPNEDRYILTSNAFLHEIDTDKKVYGDKIEVNQRTGQYKVDGKDKAPVKFIFQIEDKKK
ncbi:MAG: LptA/OstA family protein [Campylobacteraceae bacterium]